MFIRLSKSGARDGAIPLRLADHGKVRVRPDSSAHLSVPGGKEKVDRRSRRVGKSYRRPQITSRDGPASGRLAFTQSSTCRR